MKTTSQRRYEAKRRRNTVTKEGEYGTLYLYEIHYTDSDDPGCPVFTTRKWGYDLNHVYDKWYAGDCDGWKIVSIKRVAEAGIQADKAELHNG